MIITNINVNKNTSDQQHS